MSQLTSALVLVPDNLELVDTICPHIFFLSNIITGLLLSARAGSVILCLTKLFKI